MTDDIKAFIRRKRPELASYRTKKSFWENIKDGDEKKKRPLPSYGEIRRKFNDNLAKREADLLKRKDDYRSVSKTAKNEHLQNDNAKDSRTSLRSESSDADKSKSSKSSVDESRKSRRRSLEKEKQKTFLHMTEVMDGYVPSDTDSVSSTKDLNVRVTGKDTNISSSPLGLNVTECDTNDSATRKRTRLRRKASDRDSKKENKSKLEFSQLSAQKKSLSLPVVDLSSDTRYTNAGCDTRRKELSQPETSVTNDDMKHRITRQDSGDNPLKRKRDRKSHHLHLEDLNSKTNQSFDSVKTPTSESPKTPTYDQTSQLTGIRLRSPGVTTSDSNTELLKPGLQQGDKVGILDNSPKYKSQFHIKTTNRNNEEETSVKSPTGKKQYESIFLTRHRNQYDDTTSREELKHQQFEKFPKSVSKSESTGLKVHEPLSIDTSFVSEDSQKGSKDYDTLDSVSSEHRWSTIDSGISVAWALQGHIKSPKQKADNVTVEAPVYRQRSPSSSDSDDDSGISWDDLKEFREVPLVVIDKAPDEDSVQISNVKIELENHSDEQEKTCRVPNETASRHSLDTVKLKSASRIGARINERFKIRRNDENENVSDEEIERPLRTSTPTGARVPVILEAESPRDVPPTSERTPDVSLLPETGSAIGVNNGNVETTERPSRLYTFMQSKINFDAKSDKENNLGQPVSPSNNTNEQNSTQNGVQLRDKPKLQLTMPRPLSGDVFSRKVMPPSGLRERIKSEPTPTSTYQVRSHSLTRQTSPLDSREDVLTKRSPFRLPSSLTSRSSTSMSPVRTKIPYTSQYQTTHTHSRTDYNPPGVLYRTKSNPILYEPQQRQSRVTDREIRPVISARSSVLTRGRAVPPPLFTPPPLQPSSLASRLLPQRRRSLQKSIDMEDASSVYTPYTTDDEEHNSDSDRNHQDSKQKPQNDFPNPQTSTTTVPTSGIFSDSDNDGSERTPRKILAPSERLLQKFRSRTSSASSRPIDLSFSDSECGSEVSLGRKRRRSRTHSTDIAPKEDDMHSPDINVHLTSAEVGGKKMDRLHSEKASQSRKQMSLSKTHKTSSKQVDRDGNSDEENVDDIENISKDSVESLKRRKDQNNNMISKQSKILSLEQLAEEEIVSNASKLQIDMYKHKKHFEKDLAKRLEATMEESDNLVNAIRKSMNEGRAKDKVQQALKNVSEVIKFDIIRDYRAKIQWYKVEISLGSYTHNVYARKTSNFRVTVSCEIPNGPKLSKDIHLDFPESVDLDQLEILQVGNDLQLRVPFSTWTLPKTMDDVIEADGGDPKDALSRIGFLEKAYKKLGLQWPPEGASAHFEYLSSKDENVKDNVQRKTLPKPPDYQKLINSGQLKEIIV